MKDRCKKVLKNGNQCKNGAKCDGYCDTHMKKLKKNVVEKVIKNKKKLTKVEDPPDAIDPRVQQLIEINKSVPGQRTPGWYDLRYNAITASDCAKVLLLTQYEMKLYEDKVIHIKTKTPKLGSCCYTGKNIKEIYRKKVLPQQPHKKMYSKALVHGTRFENVCAGIYEHRTGRRIIDFGLMPHPDLSFIAASPDGITECGRMIEIKAPISREIIGIPLIYYWMQMQQQGNPWMSQGYDPYSIYTFMYWMQMQQGMFQPLIPHILFPKWQFWLFA